MSEQGFAPPGVAIQNADAALLRGRVRALLWDVDGTLFSAEGIIHSVYQRIFASYKARRGRPARTPTLEEIIAEVGKPVREIFANLAPDLNDDERAEMSLGILHGLVVEISQGAGEHYAGAATTLQALAVRGYEFYSVSNGRFPYIEAILKANGAFGLFRDVPVVDNRRIHNKTELVRHVLETYGIEPHAAVLIGDRAADRDAAVANDVPFIACRYGHGAPAEWTGAAAIVDSPVALLEIL